MDRLDIGELLTTPSAEGQFVVPVDQLPDIYAQLGRIEIEGLVRISRLPTDDGKLVVKLEKPMPR